MDEGDVLTTLKILIIGESGVGKSRYVIDNSSGRSAIYQQSAISNADEQMQALSASISVSRY